jgi:hypothetical protein
MVAVEDVQEERDATDLDHVLHNGLTLLADLTDAPAKKLQNGVMLLKAK